MKHPFLEFLIEESNRVQCEPVCRFCGNAYVFIDVTLWVDGQNEASTISLPVCLNCKPEAFTTKDLPMIATPLQAYDASGWKQAYLAALFETDRSKISSLMMAAEIAIVLRARELFAAEGDHREEKAALDAALLGLHSLRGVNVANDSPVRRIMAANDLAA